MFRPRLSWERRREKLQATTATLRGGAGLLTFRRIDGVHLIRLELWKDRDRLI